jgi:hypothetical protein
MGERPWRGRSILAPGHAVFPPPAVTALPLLDRTHPVTSPRLAGFLSRPVPSRETHHNLHHPSLHFLRWPGWPCPKSDRCSAHCFATCTFVGPLCLRIRKWWRKWTAYSKAFGKRPGQGISTGPGLVRSTAFGARVLQTCVPNR